KAGGPITLYRFAEERVVSINTAAAGGNAALLAADEGRGEASMRVLRTSMLALALAGGPLGAPAGAPGQALAADDEPAACTDQRLNRRIKEQYEFADSIRDSKRTLREQADIKEIGLGSAPISS